MKWVPKTWGGEKWVCNLDQYCCKKLLLMQGHFCSFHSHKIKDECFHINQGKVLLLTSWEDALIKSDKILFIYDKQGNVLASLKNIEKQSFCAIKEEVLNVGDTVHIFPGLRHLFFGLEDSEILEVSTHHEDSDSYRLTESA